MGVGEGFGGGISTPFPADVPVSLPAVILAKRLDVAKPVAGMPDAHALYRDRPETRTDVLTMPPQIFRAPIGLG